MLVIILFMDVVWLWLREFLCYLIIFLWMLFVGILISIGFGYLVVKEVMLLFVLWLVFFFVVLFIFMDVVFGEVIVLDFWVFFYMC